MPILVLLLLVGVLLFLFWKRQTTSLTRNCRWRQVRRSDGWRCAYCGAEQAGAPSPTTCRRSEVGR